MEKLHEILFRILVLLTILTQINLLKTKSELSVERESYPDDSPERYFYSNFNRNIYNIPTSGKAAIKPWSGSYWPISLGGIAYRYGAQVKIYSQPSDHLARYRTPNFEKYVDTNYSPAEKYDLLVGDYNYTLTREARLKQAAAAGWEGICHGWALASFLQPRPVRNVTLIASDGKTKITFLPDDIKALISQFYASSYGYFTTNFIGNICPVYAAESRNILFDRKCYDNNPATFTIIAGNQIGISRRVMVFDNRPDPEIWNFPSYQYDIKYFNPISGKKVNSLGQARISIDQARNSINSTFLRYSAKNSANSTSSFLGLILNLTYTAEINPKRSQETYPDREESQQYKYLLELDRNNQIVGGNWLNNDHPDFIWKIDARYPFKKDPNDIFGVFDGSVSKLKQMTNAAKKISLHKQVIYSLVRYLIINSS